MTLDCTCTRLNEAEAKAALWDGIVRCCDCEWFCEGVAKYDTASSCRLLGIITYQDFFCAVGIKKEVA